MSWRQASPKTPRSTPLSHFTLIINSPPIYIDLITNYFKAESSFYMVGDIDAARAKGEKILADLEKEKE